MLQKTKEYLLSLIREPDFKEQTGIFTAKLDLLESLIVMVEQAPPFVWEKWNGIGIDVWTVTTRYKTEIDSSFLHQQSYRQQFQHTYLLVEERTEYDVPSVPHFPKTTHHLSLFKQEIEIGSVQGKRIKQLYETLEQKGIEDSSFASFKAITEGLLSAPQKGDRVSLSEALSNLHNYKLPKNTLPSHLPTSP